MFEKLVVSTSQRRRGRTGKFFFATVVVYLSTLAIAFALSIFLSAPQLADSTVKPLWIVGLPPAQQAPSVVSDSVNSRGATRQDLRNLQPLERLMEHPQTSASRILIPTGVDIRGENGVPGGDPNAPPNSIGVIGGDLRTTDAPPRPPDPPRAPARSTQEDNRPLRLTSTVLQGKAIERRTPIYPPLAKQIHLQGDVSVEVIISPDGRVESARVVSGHPLLAPFAREAALGWRFEPTLLNGVPVRVTGVITFVFKLND